MSPVGHAIPHALQFAGSLCVSTHALPQTVPAHELELALTEVPPLPASEFPFAHPATKESNAASAKASGATTSVLDRLGSDIRDAFMVAFESALVQANAPKSTKPRPMRQARPFAS
jgi:hypothetical protein